MSNNVLKRCSYYPVKPVTLQNASLLHKRASSCIELFHAPDRQLVSTNRNKTQIFARGPKSALKTLGCSQSGTKHLIDSHHRRDDTNEGFVEEISPLSERGVPEGQEDPDVFSSQNLLAENKSIRASTPKRSSILSSVLNLYQSVPNLQLLFRSFKQPSKKLSSKEKNALNEWAMQKILNRLNLPFPNWDTKSSSENSAVDEISAKHSSTKLLDETVESSFSCGNRNDEEKVIRTFACFRNFYAGKPHFSYLVISSKRISVTDSCSTTLWKADLCSLVSVLVRWNYSVLVLRSLNNDVVSEFCLNFLDPTELRSTASWLNVLLTKMRKSESIVTVESLSCCRLYWETILAKWASEQIDTKVVKKIDVKYVGLAYFEESLCVLENPSALITSCNASCLMYKWSDSSSWQAGYFKICSGMLCYYNQCTDSAPSMSLSLSEDECKGYGRNFHSPRPYTLEIQFNGGKCLFLATASEAEANDWLLLLSQALITENLDHTQRPTACGLLVSDREAIVFQLAQNFTVLSSTPIEAISVIRRSENDTFCLVEFDYREAHEGGGDWILYFQAESSLDEFLYAAQCSIEQLPVTSSLKLRNKNLTLISGSSCSTSCN